MKKLLSAFVCALMMCALSVCAFAEGDRLYDDAGLLSESEAAQVSALLDDVSAEHGANVVIVTTNEALGDPEADARATYESICSGDGVIFLLSMNGREWAIWATEGYAREALHEDAREKVFDDIRGYLANDDFAAGFAGFAEGCDEMLTLADSGTPYKKPMSPWSIPIALGIGLVAALIGTGTMKAQLRTVAAQRHANSYIPNNGFNVTYSRDIFLYKTLTVSERESNNSSSSGDDDGGSHGTF